MSKLLSYATAPDLMGPRVQLLLALSAFACVGVALAVAQSVVPLTPLIVNVLDIDREYDHIHVTTPKISKERASEQTFHLSFSFKTKPQDEVESMVEDGVRSNRLVRVMNGTNFIAECGIAGGVTFRKSENETLYGLILTFNSLAEAERVAEVMREDWDTYFRRRLNDRRSCSDYERGFRVPGLQ